MTVPFPVIFSGCSRHTAGSSTHSLSSSFPREGMSKDMKRKFNFVNIAGGAHSELVDVTRTAVFADYEGAAAV